MTIRDCLLATPSPMIRNGHLFLMTRVLTDTAQAHNTVHCQIKGFKHTSTEMFYSVEKVEESRSDVWYAPRLHVISVRKWVFPSTGGVLLMRASNTSTGLNSKLGDLKSTEVIQHLIIQPHRPLGKQASHNQYIHFV